MADDQIKLIWDDAVRQYDETTGINLHDAHSFNLRSAEDLLNLLEERQAKFSEFRSKKAKMFSVLSHMLTPIERLGKVASDGASTVFAPSPLIFGAVIYLIDVRIPYFAYLVLCAARGVSATYDAVVSLFETMNESICRLSVHLQHELTPALRRIVNEILVTLMSIYAMSTKCIKEGRLVKYLKGLLGRDSAVQGALVRLRTLTETEVNMVGALILSQASRTGKVVDNVHLHLIDTIATTKDTNVRVKDMQEQLSSVVSAGKGGTAPPAWGSLSIPDRIRPRQRSSPHFTGRRSVLDKLVKYFGEYQDDPRRIREFLLHGMGGAGKSQLAMKFAEEAEDR
ncbi:MAG: hypothetical protein M1826_007294 [Phylliscum demangeonii]|nr:MAG: hypothetical protein M1826_007294 [Phylliscum demangeonii]